MLGSHLEEKEIKKMIKSLDPEVFDGHTEFFRFSLEEKIIWLSQISLFLIEVYQSLLKES